MSNDSEIAGMTEAMAKAIDNRVNEAIAANAARRTTVLRPKRSIQAMTVIRHREITLGRSLTEPEKDEYLRSLCASK